MFQQRRMQSQFQYIALLGRPSPSNLFLPVYKFPAFNLPALNGHYLRPRICSSNKTTYPIEYLQPSMASVQQAWAR